LTVAENGAQRASISRSARVAGLALAIALAGVVAAVNPGPASAAGLKVVVIVGPVGSSTSSYITSAKRYAAQARSYGASVVEIYSPNATWSRVKAAAQGAKVIIYLGHGNGSPSPYGAFSKFTKDGFGLNATAGRGNSNTKYYGEYYVRTAIKLAPNAVVILNRLCYASGNSEWGSPNPTKTVAKQRVDNYGAGFLRAGAKAVFAEAITDPRYIIKNLYTSNRTMREIFFASPYRTMSYRFHFVSSRTSWAVASMDPYRAGKYYRSVIGKLSVTAAEWRAS